MEQDTIERRQSFLIMNSYELSRDWFDWCFDNPELITPTHTALYFFIIEHCNRLGWKEKFGLPMEMAKDAIGVKNYRTYSKTFSDLEKWGFIKIVQKSKNQYSSNVIAIVKNTKAKSKALDKAMQSHTQKQSQKQVHGIVGIDKPNNLKPNNLKPNNNASLDFSKFDSSGIKDHWSLWVEFKQDEFKKSYKSVKYEQIAVDALAKLSRGSTATAEQIIIQSIGNRYQGLFELKHQANGTSTQTPKRTLEDQTRSVIERIHGKGAYEIATGQHGHAERGNNEVA